MIALSRKAITARLVVLWLLATLVVTTACGGCGASSQQKTLKVTLTSVNVARAAFEQWDDQTQATIVTNAKTLDEGQTALAIHRVKRDRVVAAFEVSYHLLALAATDPADDKLMAAISAATSLWGVYETVIGHAPPAALEIPIDIVDAASTSSPGTGAKP